VIARAQTLAESSFNFNMAAALAETRANPRDIDLHRIADGVALATEIGLSKMLRLAALDMKDHSLDARLFIARYPDCANNDHLERLSTQGVTSQGGPSFSHNNGKDTVTYDDSVADNRLICFLLAKGFSAGKFIILPKDLFASLAAKEKLQFHVSPAFVVKKRDSSTGRLVVNFSEDGPNFEGKPVSLTETMGPIKAPQYADICRLLINAKKAFPGKEIIGLRRDIDGAYNRLLYNARAALTCAFAVEIDGNPHIVAPIVAMMGDQQVNWDFDQVSRAIAEVLALKAKELSGSDLPLTTICTDDIIALGDRPFIDATSSFIAETAGSTDNRGLLGYNAIALSKDLSGSSIEILGWMFDCAEETISPNPHTIAKLFSLFFTTLGPNPAAGQRIALPLLQRIASHAIRTANVVTAMLPFSRSFSAATTRVSRRGDAFLTKACIFDIIQWQALLTAAITDTRILTCPTSTPPIRQKLYKTESVAEHQTRASLHASTFASSDAATGALADSSPMLGGVTPGHRWFHLKLPPSATRVADLRGVNRLADINMHEATALALTAVLGVAKLNIDYPIDSSPLSARHLQLWCDNTAAVSLIRTNRANFPILALVLNILTYLQVHHRCLITVGHVAGVLNLWADAVSRDFAVPNGLALKAEIQASAVEWIPSQAFTSLIDLAYRSSAPTDWNPLVSQVIAQELACLSPSSTH